MSRPPRGRRSTWKPIDELIAEIRRESMPRHKYPCFNSFGRVSSCSSRRLTHRLFLCRAICKMCLASVSLSLLGQPKRAAR